MPLSSTAQYSCDVNKDGGSDLSKYGPFNTIQAALNFMVAKYGALMSADRHGVIHIGPGVYPETVQLTSAHNYIDLVGEGRNVTIIEFSANEGFSITDGSAVNRVCGLTIHCTATAPDTFALNVVNNQGVRFEDCLIRSGTNCMNNFGANSRMVHCDIVSESTNSGQQLNVNIAGVIESCYLEGKSAGGGSVLIGSLLSTGEVRKSRLVTLQSNGPDVRTVNFLSGGRLAYCTLESQGRAVYEANGGSSIEFCHLSSEGAESTPVIERLSGCSIRNCFLHQKAETNLPVIGTGSVADTSVIVIDSTFLAPHCTGNMVANLEGDGSRWEGCRMIGADGATSGYALQASALDRIVVVKDIVSNRPIDPLIRLRDNGLAAKGIGETKGYSQKRWWALHGLGTTTQGLGVEATEAHPLSYGGGTDAAGMYRMLQAQGANTCAIYSNQMMRRIYKPKLHVKFRLTGVGSPNPGLRFWCGFFTIAPPTNSDDLSTIACPGAGLLLSYGHFFDGAASTGVGTTDYTALTPSGLSTDPHVFSMYFDDLNDRVIYQMDGLDLAQISNPYLPSTTDEMVLHMQLTSTDGNSKSFVFYDAWCEFDP